MSTTQRPRGKAVTRNGRALSFSIDALTHSRIVYACHLVSRTLEVPASMATIVRAAVAHYLDHLEGVAKRLRTKSPTNKTLDIERLRERQRVFSANHGGETPWERFPEGDMEQDPLPTWDALVKAHMKHRPLPEIPGLKMARLLRGEPGDDQ